MPSSFLERRSAGGWLVLVDWLIGWVGGCAGGGFVGTPKVMGGEVSKEIQVDGFGGGAGEYSLVVSPK